MKAIAVVPVVLLHVLAVPNAEAQQMPSESGSAFPGLKGDKTFVVWTTPQNLNQRGGGVLTLDDGRGHFDGIVFAELAAQKWMAGSDLFKRSRRDQEGVREETADSDTQVQVAVVYDGTDVTIFRNGLLYSQHTIPEPQTFRRESVIVMGPRHLGNRDYYAGSIDDARIYNRALTREQVAQLEPNQLSEPPPVAWWHFENESVDDAMGAFRGAELLGNARIEAGRLVLDGVDSGLMTAPPREPDVTDEFALHYHLMHPGAASMPGDPNAAFCLDGVYHLHYILAHPWRGGNSFSFVHVTSPDMLHWTWKSTKLQPSFTGHGMFSGTGFLTKDGRPAVIYHGQASGRNQIVVAKDRTLADWQKPFAVEVATKEGRPAEISHWDPDCFRVGEIYYAISGGPNPPVFKSQDLKSWTLVGDFIREQPADVTIGEDVSCPNFFRLGDKWMLLCISHPLGCRYYIGQWDEDAEQFVPERHGRMNWPRLEQPVWGLFNRTDFFAPESVETPDGRRVMWAWITSAGSDKPLLNKTIQSLPRELSLSDDGDLRIHPLRELETLRAEGSRLKGVVLDRPITGHGEAVPPTKRPQLKRLAELPGEAAEIRITVDRDQASRKLFGFTLFSDGEGGGLPIVFRPETGTLRVGRTEAPFAVSDLPINKDVELRIYVDKYLVEVFANGRQALLAAHLDWQGNRDLDGWTVGAETRLREVEVWKLNRSNEGFFTAQETRVWEPDTR